MKTGKIYKLYNTVDDRYYIGSTIQKYLSNRLSIHKSDANKDKRPGNILHKAIKEIGAEKWFIKELFSTLVENRREICRIEDNYIVWDDKNCLNQKKASGVYRDEYKSSSEYEKARYQCSNFVYEKERAKTKWQKLKNNPVKYDEYKQKQRERDRRRRAQK